MDRFARALQCLAEGPLIDLQCAPLYRTAAVFDVPGPDVAQVETAQADFINTVVTAHLADPLEPGPATARHLVGWCKRLEVEAGRRPDAAPNSPRTLDLDLLLLGSLCLHLPAKSQGLSSGDWPGEITVPHARLARRRFVLQPLADLLPDLALPGPTETTRLTVSEALGALDRSKDPEVPQTLQRVERLDDELSRRIGWRERWRAHERGTM